MMPVDKNPSLHSWRHHSTMNHYGAVSYCPSMDPSQHENGDRRTAHNAIERQRRECLNSKFEQLAHALPGLQNVRRPSKSMIVSKSLEFVTKSVHRDSTYQNKIRQLRKEHDTLKKHTERSQQQLRKRIQSDPPETNNKKKKVEPAKQNKIHPKKPAVHKFVHHHASSSNQKPKSPLPTSKKPSSPTPFSFVPPTPSQSWPLLDLSALQHPDTLAPSPPLFYSPDMLNALIQPPHQDPSSSYFWK